MANNLILSIKICSFSYARVIINLRMNKKRSEPVRHHYIPQFIIKNFAKDELNFVNYYDKKRKKILTQPTEEVFKYNNLYRDEVNTPDDPTKIETDFAKYEQEMSEVINGKLLRGDEIELTVEENESLLLFLTLLELRSKSTYKIFVELAKDESQKNNIYAQYQEDGDYVALWRRNLGFAVQCRSVNQVFLNPNIDYIFKFYLRQGAFGIAGRFLIIVESRGGEDFFLCDGYPLNLQAETSFGFNAPMMTFFPISPNRMIISACFGVKAAREDIRIFQKSFFSAPYKSHSGGYIFKVKKIYTREIEFLNDGMFNFSKEGLAFKETNRFFVVDRNS